MSISACVKSWAALLTAGLLAGCSSSQPGEPVFQSVPSASMGSVDLPEATPAPAPTGQSSKPAPSARSQPPESTTSAIVTPDHSIAGKVVAVEDVGRFAVLNFPLGHMPALESTLQVYRQGLKVGELKVTGPQKDDNIVADIRAGECRVGDEVRDR